ncbi:insulinase family protein [Mucilaginibacter roseus]|uniref:Insulinase family protein n=1 Tax=Mucilaginibacter roseus TaxID=1528868 RepID=A0ABS8U529_9SPHI|nr:pitrilysin family protein [Mucilaginibacter roseus]MCD8742228.1 insulinase family protein [Mucilaginibacter roseus]
MKRFLPAVLMAISSFAFGQSKPADVNTFTLANGMKFLVMEDSSIPNANMYLFYRVGSRNEYPGITGLSHFFEHMMFNGSKKFGPKQFDNTMEFNGGANNAYTTQNVTVYTDWFPASAMETMFDLESDRIANLTIDPKMVQSERGVVSSEKSTGLENSPWEQLSELIYSTAFTEHSYHWPVIGYQTDIDNWTKEDLERYFRTYYAPNNCVVVICGNVKTADVKKLADKYMAPIPAQPAPPVVHLKEPEQLGERRVEFKKDLPVPYLLMGYHTPAARDSDYYALSILSDILSSGNSSRLYSAIVDKKQLATSISSSFDESFDPGLFMIYGVVAKTSNETAVEKAIDEELSKVIEQGVTERELQKVKNQKLVQLYRQLETINGKANSLGTYELFFGDYKKLFDAPAEFNKVTAADIKRVAAKYLKQTNRTVGVAKSTVK